MYDYDGYLEKTEGKKAERKKAEPVVRRSRYISTLLEKAEDRKKEEAIIFDRRHAIHIRTQILIPGKLHMPSIRIAGFKCVRNFPLLYPRMCIEMSPMP